MTAAKDTMTLEEEMIIKEMIGIGKEELLTGLILHQKIMKLRSQL